MIDQATYSQDRATALELVNRVKHIIQEFKEPFLTRGDGFARGVQNIENNLKAFEDPKKMIFEAIGSDDVALLKLCLAIAPEMVNVAPRDDSNPYWQKKIRCFSEVVVAAILCPKISRLTTRRCIARQSVITKECARY